MCQEALRTITWKVVNMVFLTLWAQLKYLSRILSTFGVFVKIFLHCTSSGGNANVDWMLVAG